MKHFVVIASQRYTWPTRIRECSRNHRGRCIAWYITEVLVWNTKRHGKSQQHVICVTDQRHAVPPSSTRLRLRDTSDTTRNLLGVCMRNDSDSITGHCSSHEKATAWVSEQIQLDSSPTAWTYTKIEYISILEFETHDMCRTTPSVAQTKWSAKT